MASPNFELWSADDDSPRFLIPEGAVLPAGGFRIRTTKGRVKEVDADTLAPFEVTEDQARRWAKEQLGETLEELKHGIDERLAELRRPLDEKNRTPVTENNTVTPNATPALFELLRKLPGVIGNSLSREQSRMESAKTAMANLQRQLKEAGIDLDERFTNFPDRVADLRKNLDEQMAAKKLTTMNERPYDQR